MASTNLVSVIITTYYRNTPLRRAIEQIINQTYGGVEVIVVDDSGESYAEQVVSDFDEVKYISHDRNKGQIEAWHTGYAAANGEFIQLHDDDDWIHHSKIEEQVKVLNKQDADVVFCNIRESDGRVIEPSYTTPDNFMKMVLSFNSYPCQTTSMLIRSSILDPVFPLNYYPAGTDIALQIELTRRARFCHLDKELVKRDVSGNSQGASIEAYKSHLRMMDDYKHLYDSYGKSFTRKVAAGRWRKLGSAYMNESRWSPFAILSFFKAFYLHPGVKWRYFHLFIASLGGKLGFYIGRFAKSLVMNR